MTVFATTLKVLKKLLDRREKKVVPFSDLFVRFQNILERNNTAMQLMADMRGKMGGEYVFDRKYLIDSVGKMAGLARGSAYDLNFITNNQHLEIFGTIENLIKQMEATLTGKLIFSQRKSIYVLNEIEENMEDIVGVKAYNLSRMLSLPKVNISRGFIVSIAGFRNYLAYNDLYEKIEMLIKAWREEKKSIQAISGAIQLMILGGEIPPELRRTILASAENICDGQTRFRFFSVRSSAVGEDGELSFAGLHDSLLNVPYGELLSGFKKVLASLYNPASLEYRRRTNLFSIEIAMPVLYQNMIDSRVAGVLYTLDPNRPERTESLLNASWGLGRIVMEGRGSVDIFRVSRKPSYDVIEETISDKQWMLSPLTDGSLQTVAAELRSKPCLTPNEAASIVQVGMILERYFKRPLDIEWSLDQDGAIWVHQARQLQIPRTEPLSSSKLMEAVKGHRVLLKDKGIIAYRGIGAGPVWIATDRDSLNGFPSGGVLVCRHSSPWLASVIPRAHAIVTDVGAATGHMATVAREFRVPTIVDSGVGTKRLPAGKEVTVDAKRNIIYEGCIHELLQHELLDKSAFEVSPEFQILHRLMKEVSPLYLTDPQATNFTAADCKTFHDIIRFMHEKAFQALVRVGKHPHTLLQKGGRRLRSKIPLDLILIDVGGGLADGAENSKVVDPDQITSIPFKAIWEGLNSPQTWSTEPIGADFKGLMSSLTKTQTAQVMGNTLTGINLAVVSANYVNLCLPLGYHLTTIDAAMEPEAQNNHISFRFVGGVTDITRRSRRAALLVKILEKTEYKVETKDDLVLARANDLSEDRMKRHLYLLGRIIGFSRQLDILLKEDSDIDFFLKKFWEQQNQINQESQNKES